MKASIKFRDDQKPLLRAKIPLNILTLPFQSGVSAGESKELSLNLSTLFDSGPALKFSYRPNDLKNPFSFIFKTGIGHFGSPTNSPLTMSAEFNLVGNQNPTFFIHFKPEFGSFSLKKSHSSGRVGHRVNGGENGVNRNGYFEGDAVISGTVESSSAAGLVVSGMVKGTEVSARTPVPLLDFAVVNCRWGLRVPPISESPHADELDAVLVSRKGDRTIGIRLPQLLMNKIGIEHVTKSKTKGKNVGDEAEYGKVIAACLDVKKQLEQIQAENGLLSKALKDLKSDIAAGKLDFIAEHHRSKYSRGGNTFPRGGNDKKSLDVTGFGAGEDEVLKLV